MILHRKGQWISGLTKTIWKKNKTKTRVSLTQKDEINLTRWTLTRIYVRAIIWLQKTNSPHRGTLSQEWALWMVNIMLWPLMMGIAFQAIFTVVARISIIWLCCTHVVLSESQHPNWNKLSCIKIRVTRTGATLKIKLQGSVEASRKIYLKKEENNQNKKTLPGLLKVEKLSFLVFIGPYGIQNRWEQRNQKDTGIGSMERRLSNWQAFQPEMICHGKWGCAKYPILEIKLYGLT